MYGYYFRKRFKEFSFSSRRAKIGVWINNAGINHTNHNFLELDESEIESVINTNITGTIRGAKVALDGMVAQGFGSLYNMEGTLYGLPPRKLPKGFF